MARFGISYREVAMAAQQLVAEGKNPTIESIRTLTKTGSNSTIANFLKTWRSKQSESQLLTDKDNLPAELVATVKGLWTQVMNQAEDKVTVIQENYDQSRRELNDQLISLQQDHTRLQQQAHQLTQEKEALLHEKNGLEQIRHQQEKEKVALTASIENLQHQLQEKQIRVEELHRLHQQVQKNLEHYREASREQRIQDQQQQEAIQAQLEQSIQQLKQDLAASKRQQQLLQKSHDTLEFEKSLLQKNHEQLTSQHEKAQTQLLKLKQENIQHLHAEKYWKEQYQELKKKFEEQSKMLIDLKTQTAVLTDKYTTLQQQLKEKEDHNKYLTNEKCVLEQEKAHLIGQLKQFEKNIR